MQSLEANGVTQHHIVVVPCDRQTGHVPQQALVSVLSWHATRLSAALATAAAQTDAEVDDEDNGVCGVPAGSVDWQAVGHDGSDVCLAELQEAVRETLAHQDATAADAAESTCRLVLVYLDCAPDSPAEASFLRRLADRGVVVHVFGRLKARAPGLAGLPHVALHHQDGELPAAQVWAFARRNPPASLRPALAVARFVQFCSTDYRLAVSEDFEQLLSAVATPLLNSELTAWQVLDYLNEFRPQLRALADGGRPSMDGLTAETELMTVGIAFKDRTLRLSRGSEEAFASPERLARVANNQARLSKLLANAQLVSVPLVASGGSGLSNDSCAGRFAGLLMTPGLNLAEFEYSSRPELEQAMVRRKARFVAGIQPPSGSRFDVNSWRIGCRRLDEADDCREVVRGLARLAGCTNIKKPAARASVVVDDSRDDAPWAAAIYLSPELMRSLRMRLRLASDFGEVKPSGSGSCDDAIEEDAEEMKANETDGTRDQVGDDDAKEE